MSYWLHPLAEYELAETAVYYATHASRVIAHAFTDEFERTINLLIQNQQMGTLADEGLRIRPLHRFPYSVVYREATAGPQVYAIAHQKREPRYWQARL